MKTKAKLKRKLVRWAKKNFKNQKTVFAIVLLCLVVGAVAMQNKPLAADPASCRPLLDLIARAESKGNYNAYFGNAGNTKIKFTNMTIAEVLDWQDAYVQKGNPSSAIGKYQIVNTTLEGLVRQLGLDPRTKFTPELQDRLAFALLERRGSNDYVSGKLSREAFAGNLAKEWASLPSVTGKHPDKSYYAADGLNVALVSVGDLLNAIAPIRPA